MAFEVSEIETSPPSPEYLFWKEFFKTPSKYKAGFEAAVKAVSKGQIKWSFLKPDDSAFASQSAAKQYDFAISFVINYMNNKDSWKSDVYNMDRMNSLTLWQRAKSVVDSHKLALQSQKFPPGSAGYKSHEKMLATWEKVLAAVTDAKSKA